MFTKAWGRALAIAAVSTFATAAPNAFAQGADPHAHHHMMRDATTSTADYTLPSVMLVRDDGQTVSLKNELDDGRPVVLTFIYTSCTTICPVTSQTLSQLQRKVGRTGTGRTSRRSRWSRSTIHMREYATRFGAGPEWQHSTGTIAASIATQKVVNVYREDKMNHNPVVLLHAAPGKPWLRIDGLATADGLLHAYQNLVASD